MNPEFERNLWLETTPARLAWTGVVLALIYGAAWILGGPVGRLEALGAAGGVVFAGTGLIWAPRAAGRALVEEVTQRTWEFQRLSALEPWTMTWGKLFGVTSLAWIAAGSGLALMVVAEIGHGTGDNAVPEVITLVGIALFLQANALLLSLLSVRRARADGRPVSLRFGLGGVIGVMLLVWALQHALPTRGIPGAGLGGPLSWFGMAGSGLGSGELRWWGLALTRGWFTAFSAAVFAAWALTASWRLMRLELQMQNAPWLWAAFVLFAGVYAAGFVDAGPFKPATGLRFAIAGAVFAVCAYAAAFAEPADRVHVRSFVQALGRSDLRGAVMKMPLVIAPVKLAFLAVVGVALSAAEPTFVGAQASPLFALACFAFLLRDLAVIAYFRFGSRPGRGDVGAVLGVVLLYWIGALVGGTLAGDLGRSLFAPQVASPLPGLVAAAVEAAVIGSLAWRRIAGAQGLSVNTKGA